jgi:hypothetical protein
MGGAPGAYDIVAYLQRLSQNALTSADRLFEKLMMVAELDAKELHGLLGQNHEERKLLTSRAGRVLTKTIQSLWKDRKVTVEFNLDEPRGVGRSCSCRTIVRARHASRRPVVDLERRGGVLASSSRG